MTRRRRGLWWELKRSARRARRQMMPHRVLWRLLSGPEVMRALRGTTVRATAESRRRDARRWERGKFTARERAAGKQ